MKGYENKIFRKGRPTLCDCGHKNHDHYVRFREDPSKNYCEHCECAGFHKKVMS